MSASSGSSATPRGDAAPLPDVPDAVTEADAISLLRAVSAEMHHFVAAAQSASQRKLTDGSGEPATADSSGAVPSDSGPMGGTADGDKEPSPEDVIARLRRKVDELTAENALLREKLAAKGSTPKPAQFASPKSERRQPTAGTAASPAARGVSPSSAQKSGAARASLLLTSPAKLIDPRPAPQHAAPRSPSTGGGEHTPSKRGPRLSASTVDAVIESVGSPPREHRHHNPAEGSGGDISAWDGEHRDEETPVAASSKRPNGDGTPADTSGTLQTPSRTPSKDRSTRAQNSSEQRSSSTAAAAASKERLGNFNPNARPATHFSRRLLATSGSGRGSSVDPMSIKKPLGRQPATASASGSAAHRQQPPAVVVGASGSGSGRQQQQQQQQRPSSPSSRQPQARVRGSDNSTRQDNVSSFVRQSLAQFRESPPPPGDHDRP